MNNFISKQLAVERKINDIKKKRKGYGFFKNPDDGSAKVSQCYSPTYNVFFIFNPILVDRIYYIKPSSNKWSRAWYILRILLILRM